MVIFKQKKNIHKLIDGKVIYSVYFMSALCSFFQSHECSICLDETAGKEIGIPNAGCGHRFCLDCIVQWAGTKKPTCPLDRKPFTCIAVYSAGMVLKERRVTALRSDFEEPYAPVLQSLRIPIDWAYVRRELIPAYEFRRSRPHDMHLAGPAGATSYGWWAANGASR